MRSTKRVKGPALQRITTKAPALPVIACFWEAGLSHKKSWKIRQESHSGEISIESIGNGPVNQDFLYYTICFSEGFSIFQPAIHGNLCFLHFYMGYNLYIGVQNLHVFLCFPLVVGVPRDVSAIHFKDIPGPRYSHGIPSQPWDLQGATYSKGRR